MIDNILQKIKRVNFRRGLDRIYSISTLIWFFSWYSAFLLETLESKVNLYTNDLTEMIWGHIFVLATPFILYIILILIFKIFLWVTNGFRETESMVPLAKVKIFTGEDSLLFLMGKHFTLILGIIIALILISIFISFTVTFFNSYDEKWNASQYFRDLPQLPGLPPLPKLPKLKLPEIKI